MFTKCYSNCGTMIFMLDIAKLLLELQHPGHCASGENPLEIHPRVLWHLSIPNVAQELVVHTGCEAVKNSACRCSQDEKSLCVNSGAASLAPST